jgi:adenylylsulfate kinase
VLVVCGPPGSGKTPIATRAHERLTAGGREFRLLHSEDFSRRTYEQMYQRVMDPEDDCLLDGTFYQPE